MGSELRASRNLHHGRRAWVTGTCLAWCLLVSLIGLLVADPATAAIAPASVRVASRIAPTASLSANSVTTVLVTATDAAGVSIPMATVYLKEQSTTGGGTADVQGSLLTAGFQPFVANDVGQVVVTYRTPATLPGGGHDVITAANAGTGAAVQSQSFYYFTPTIHYSFSPEPIGAPATLAPGSMVPVVATSYDSNWQPVPYAQICVSFAAATRGTTVVGGTSTVAGTALTKGFQCFPSDAAGRVVVTYRTPSVLPTTGTDLISVQDTTGSLFNTSSLHGYSFGQLSQASMTPNPIAAMGSLAPGARVSVTVTPRDAAGAQVAGATVLLSLQSSNHSAASVADYALAPDGTWLTAAPKRFLTHTKTRLTISFTMPKTLLPVSGSDSLVATVTLPDGTPSTTTTTYTYGP